MDHETVHLPCLGCNRQVRYPKNRSVANRRQGRQSYVFCSKRCEVRWIAKEGTKQQEALWLK